MSKRLIALLLAGVLALSILAGCSQQKDAETDSKTEKSDAAITIDNIRGLTINKKLDDITPSEAFTSTTLLGPCAVNDDSKRYAI